MKAHLRKINRKKNRLQGKKKNTENSTSDLSSNPELKNSSNLSRKMDVLAEELFLSKKLERTLKNEIGMLELQIQKNQSEIADLKQFVEQIRGKFNENEQLNLGKIVTRNSSLQLKTSKPLPEEQNKEQRITRSKRASVKQ